MRPRSRRLRDCAGGKSRFFRCRQNFRDHIANVCIRRKVIHDAGPQAEFSLQFCVRQKNFASAHYLLEQLEIELIAFVLCCLIADQVAKTDRAQLDWSNQFEFCASIHCSRQALRLFEIPANRLAKGMKPVKP